MCFFRISVLPEVSHLFSFISCSVSTLNSQIPGWPQLVLFTRLKSSFDPENGTFWYEDPKLKPTFVNMKMKNLVLGSSITVFNNIINRQMNKCFKGSKIFLNCPIYFPIDRHSSLLFLRSLACSFVTYACSFIHPFNSSFLMQTSQNSGKDGCFLLWISLPWFHII